MKMNGCARLLQRALVAAGLLALAAVRGRGCCCAAATRNRRPAPATGARRSSCVLSTNRSISASSNGRSGGRFFGSTPDPTAAAFAAPGPRAAARSNSRTSGTHVVGDRVGEAQAIVRRVVESLVRLPHVRAVVAACPAFFAICSRSGRSFSKISSIVSRSCSRRLAVGSHASCARRAVGLLEERAPAAAACSPCRGTCTIIAPHDLVVLVDELGRPPSPAARSRRGTSRRPPAHLRSSIAVALVVGQLRAVRRCRGTSSAARKYSGLIFGSMFSTKCRYAFSIAASSVWQLLSM